MPETVIAEHRGANPPASWKSVSFELTIAADRTSFELAIRHRWPGMWQLIRRVERVLPDEDRRRLETDGDTREIWPRRTA